MSEPTAGAGISAPKRAEACDYTGQLAVIKKHYPQLSVNSVRWVDRGQGNFNDVLIINEELVFRFPRYSSAIRALQLEVAVLKRIRGRLSLTIPAPQYRFLNTEVAGEAFMAYPLIRGESLNRQLGPASMENRNDQLLIGLARPLATFLSELHSIPFTEFPDLALPWYDTIEQWQSLYDRVRTRLFSFMRPDAQAWTTSHFEQYLSERSHFDFARTLRHGDFGPGNLLYDPGSGLLTGVIDFSSIGLGDPAVDLAAILASASFGEAFQEQFEAIYPLTKPVLTRARFYAGTFALQEALFGIENGDSAAFEAGMATYR